MHEFWMLIVKVWKVVNLFEINKFLPIHCTVKKGNPGKTFWLKIVDLLWNIAFDMKIYSRKDCYKTCLFIRSGFFVYPLLKRDEPGTEYFTGHSINSYISFTKICFYRIKIYCNGI